MVTLNYQGLKVVQFQILKKLNIVIYQGEI